PGTLAKNRRGLSRRAGSRSRKTKRFFGRGVRRRLRLEETGGISSCRERPCGRFHESARHGIGGRIACQTGRGKERPSVSRKTIRCFGRGGTRGNGSRLPRSR